ncbi:serine/threonine-protein kinase STK11-like [Sycon ciliatum]|uniref:serine/threonine-protein kinase STK11-like n=1 Tax=Sycon ciliatum TaxID=27933 RepID=UPI0031F66A8C
MMQECAVVAGSLPGGEVDWDTEFGHPNSTSTHVVSEPHHKAASCVAGRYLKGAVLGEGSYGKVKEMLDVLSLHRRAVKILNKRRLRKIPSGESNVEREIQLLRQLKHEHVVKLIEVLYNEEKLKIYMVMEYCVCPLEEILKSTKEQKFPIKQAHNYFCQTICGVEYLHSQRVVHKDLKPDNLLLSQQQVVKICDFGVAERLDLFSIDDSIHTSQGSPVFQPPEVSLGHDSMSGFKLDVWAVGVTLFHFVSGDYPFMGNTIFQLFETIGKGVYTMPPGLSESLQDLLRGMLEYDASKRLSVHAIMQHQWFTSAHSLQKKESWLPIPPLCDFEHDPLRGMTCVDALMSLHQHNLPTCPLYLSEDHMVHLMSSAGQHSVLGSSQVLPDSILEAVGTFSVSSSSDNIAHNRPLQSIGSVSREDSFGMDSVRGISTPDAEAGDSVSKCSDSVVSRRQTFFKSRDKVSGPSSSDLSNVSIQLSHRMSDSSNPSFISSGSKRNSTHSHTGGAESSAGPMSLASHRALRPQLSPNREEDDGEVPTVDGPTANGKSSTSVVTAGDEPQSPTHCRQASAIDGSCKKAIANRKADTGAGNAASVASAPATPTQRHSYKPLKRMRKAVQCRQQ